MSLDETNHNTVGDEMDDEPRTMSLMSGVAGGGAAGLSDADLMGIDAGSGGSRISPGTVVLVVVALVAIGSIYLMRMTQGDLSTGGPGADVQVKIEEALARLTQPAALSPDDPLHHRKLQELFGDTDTIVAMFAADLSEHQVPVEYLKKNPFQMAGAQPVAAGAVAVDTSARDRARRLVELQRQVDQLSLQTVMISDNRRLAVINSEVYQPGQKLGEFTIVSMDALSVQLQAAGEMFQLTLNDKKRGR